MVECSLFPFSDIFGRQVEERGLQDVSYRAHRILQDWDDGFLWFIFEEKREKGLTAYSILNDWTRESRKAGGLFLHSINFMVI